jgi:Protein of unknown function (DUF1697)
VGAGALGGSDGPGAVTTYDMVTMPPRYLALLRAISNVGMQSFRLKMETLGFTDVTSYGMSGNLLFKTASSDVTSLERRISGRLGTAVLVWTRPNLARVLARDPFSSSVLFLKRPPTAARRRAFSSLDFEAPRPVLRGRAVFFVYPARLRGRRTPFDFESALGVQGTARSARVVKQLLARMSEVPDPRHPTRRRTN